MVFLPGNGEERRSGDDSTDRTVVIAEKPDSTAQDVECSWEKEAGFLLRLDAFAGKPGESYATTIIWTLCTGRPPDL